MLWSRIWLFSFVCVLVALWAFPSVETSYSTWSQEKGPGVPFRILRSRPLITEAEFRIRHVWWCNEPAFGRTIEERRFNVPFSPAGTVLRETGINWPSQILQTVLAVAFFLGLRWASGQRPFWPIRRPNV